MKTVASSSSSSHSSSNRYKCGVRTSFVSGFLVAMVLGYVLLYQHIISISIVPSTSDGKHSKASLQQGTGLRKEHAEELLALVKKVDTLIQAANSRKIPTTVSEGTIAEPKTAVGIFRKPQMHNQGNREGTWTIHNSKAIKAAVSDETRITVRVNSKDKDYHGLNLSALENLTAGRVKDVLMALAANIDPKYFAIFCNSLRRHNSAAAVVVFVNEPIDAQVQTLATKNHITLITYTTADLEPTFLRPYHPSSLRWILYHRLLQLPIQLGAHQQIFGDLVQKIITLDARDSAFQSDPFRLFTSEDPRLLVFGEQQHAHIRGCGWNSGWVRDCFGEEVLRRIGDQAIICSGVSMGSASAMNRYIEAMATILSGRDVDKYHHQLPRCERNGVDQGIHNVLVHAHHEALQVSVLYPDAFPVVNLQSATQIEVNDRESPRRVYMHNHFGKQEDLFAIVHQFDRSSDLQTSLAHEYVDWIDWTDAASEWAATSACQSMDYVADADLFKAQCDIGHARAISAATCCEACARKTLELQEKAKLAPDGRPGDACTAFTYTGGVCYLKNCDAQARRRQAHRWQENRRGMVMPGAVSAYLK